MIQASPSVSRSTRPSKEKEAVDTSVCSDIGLSERIRHALGRRGYPDLRRVEVCTEDGAVRLNGQVATYYLKQLAQATVSTVEGVRMLQNDLSVK